MEYKYWKDPDLAKDRFFSSRATCQLCLKLMLMPVECYWCHAHFCYKCITFHINSIAKKCPVHLGRLKMDELDPPKKDVI